VRSFGGFTLGDRVRCPVLKGRHVIGIIAVFGATGMLYIRVGDGDFIWRYPHECIRLENGVQTFMELL
jgi:hypothetical protein